MNQDSGDRDQRDSDSTVEAPDEEVHMVAGFLLECHGEMTGLLQVALEIGRPDLAEQVQKVLNVATQFQSPNPVQHVIPYDDMQKAYKLGEIVKAHITSLAEEHLARPMTLQAQLQISIEDEQTPPLVVSRVFGWLELVVPPRLREEIGDALEVITRRKLRGPALWVKVASTVFWVIVNAIREVVGK